MGQFLRAAYEVLRRERHPLSVEELTRLAIDSSILRTDGKTPSQTMKAKLSTDILRRGEQSLFMRVEKGSFALREWNATLAERIADRFQKALFDEDILVFPAESLRRYVPDVGLYSGEFDRNALQSECFSMRRRAAEEDTGVIQLVSVFVVRYGDRILTYKRTKRLPESRLHGVYSLAFGGHLNPSDLLPLLNIFDPGLGYPLLQRELNEEVRFKSSDPPKIKYWGLLYDNSRPVSRQHLGITYEVVAPIDQFEIGERGFLMDAKYESLHQIGDRLTAFENWSVILYNEVSNCKHSSRALAE
jgi:predicted NUDIX family phosphoesterase